MQSDWGGEFQGLSGFLKENGIHHRVSCPHTPQQNGLAERKHRHIVETGLALLSQAGMSPSFWDDAFVTAVHLINRLPSQTINMASPFQKLYNKQPDYSSLKIFGCLCYPLTRPYNKSKLQFRSQAATFLGYSSTHKGYKALLPQGRLIISRDIIFDETYFSFQTPHLKGTHSPPDLYAVPSPIVDTHVSPVVSSPGVTDTPCTPNDSHMSTPNHHSPVINDPPGHSLPNSPTSPIINTNSITDVIPTSESTPDTPPQSQNQPPTAPCHKMITRAKAGIFKARVFTIILPDTLPRSALAALLIPHWKQAMLDEFLTLLRNKTWTLTTLPLGKNLIGST